ncbi:MAG: hypothetical protein KDJ69_14050 [Nitratireductor sp.]|nr:hypothetical protein [Nitratireductor sp.]
MQSAHLELAIPVLPSKDVGAAVAFYVEKLGFAHRFSDDADEPAYAGVARGDVVFHLQWHDPAEWAVAVDRPMIRIVVQDVAALHAEYEGQGVFHENTAIRKTAWGTEEFAFYDGDGNGLTFMRILEPGEEA